MERLSLADRLAIERTELANERTGLAYVRTSFTLFGAGVALIHLLSEKPIWLALGWLSICGSPIVFALGSWRYRRMQTRLKRHMDQLDD
jgi:putative membrane protein